MANPRLPTAIKELKGTVQKSRENPDEPRLESIPVPAPPEHLSAAEREFWIRLKAATDPMCAFTAGDLEGFEMMVRARADYEAACKVDPPDFKTRVNLSKDVAAWFTKFGLTPQSRAAIHKLKPAAGTDEMEDFFKN